MHIGKISTIVAQVSLTSANILARENMGKRDSWEDARVSVISQASQTAAAQFNQRNAAPEAAMITAGPEKRQFFGHQGVAAGQAAEDRARRIAADFNSRFPPFGSPLFGSPPFGLRYSNNNNKRDVNSMEQGQQYHGNPDSHNQWADNNGAYQSYYSGAAAQDQTDAGDAADTEGQAYTGDAADAQDQAYAGDATDAHGAYDDTGNAQNGWQAHAAAGQQQAGFDWQSYRSAMGASWAAHAASAHRQATEAVAATAAAGNDGDWHGHVAPAQSPASSQQSEYHQGGVANPTGVQPIAPSASHDTQMVQVNEGAAGTGSSSAGKAVGVAAAAAMAGFVFGVL
ncbi:hypothetical protein QBC36DRAFT_357328 [Triangularia setosa]|uniref:Uncharacterized protein n=1 Tax=Triangularia setosa TaxID=2587417 RepID=A0AAN7AAT5_9PEZI|nr:hypothetical protein QBC36DRAFT_357328 [Podospora setosa]